MFDRELLVKIKIVVKGTSPLLMHNPQMVDPNCEWNRKIKELTSKRKKSEADYRAIELFEWYGGLYSENGIIVQPTSKLRKCLINTARINKQGKSVERALNFSELFVNLEHDGPKAIDDVFADPKYTSRLSVGLQGKRVMRVRPKFPAWTMTINGLFIEDAGLDFCDLERLIELAGQVEGIGDNRVNGYGRFVGKVVNCE